MVEYALYRSGAPRFRTGVLFMLTAYGALAVTLMMIFYALEARSRWFTLAFALS